MGVDRDDPGMRIRAAQYARIEQGIPELDIIAEDGGTGDLRARI